MNLNDILCEAVDRVLRCEPPIDFVETTVESMQGQTLTVYAVSVLGRTQVCFSISESSLLGLSRARRVTQIATALRGAIAKRDFDRQVSARAARRAKWEATKRQRLIDSCSPWDIDGNPVFHGENPSSTEIN